MGINRGFDLILIFGPGVVGSEGLVRFGCGFGGVGVGCSLLTYNVSSFLYSYSFIFTHSFV